MRPPFRRHRAGGQSMTEYLVVTCALALALLSRWGTGASAAERLLAAFARWQGNYLLTLALS